MLYETDTEYILEYENIRIIAEKKECPEDYEAYLRSQLEKVLQNAQDSYQTSGREVYETQGRPRLTEKSKWVLIRKRRDELLAECDWTQVSDAPLDDKQKRAWQIYRQALRDIPQRFELADDVIWPERP